MPINFTGLKELKSHRNFDYSRIKSMSYEAREKLKKVQTNFRFAGFKN